MDGWNIAGVTRWSLSRCRCEQEGLIMHVCVVVTSIVNLDLHVPLQACGLWQELKRVHAWAQVYVLCILGFIHAVVYASLQCVCAHETKRWLSFVGGTTLTGLSTSARSFTETEETKQVWRWASLCCQARRLYFSQNTTDMFVFELL